VKDTFSAVVPVAAANSPFLPASTVNVTTSTVVMPAPPT